MTMILPPLVIDVRVREENERGFRIWFPVVILWPILFVLVGFVLVVTVLVDIALWFVGARYHRYTLFVLYAMGLLAETRGTHAHIVSATTLVNVDII
jgi:hypothetical protein